MKILYIVPYVPNLIRVRPYNLIRYLTLQGHQVTTAAVWSDPDELKSVELLQKTGSPVIAVHLPVWRSLLNCVLALPQSIPLQARYCWQPALFEQILALLASSQNNSPFDVVHVEHIRAAEYGLRLLARQKQHNGRAALPPVVWDSVDCISSLLRQSTQRGGSFKSRAIAAVEVKRTARYERQAVAGFDHVLVTSPVDRRALIDLNPNGTGGQKIEVLHNGVDLDYFKPGSDERRSDTLVVSGKMSYHANVAMVQHLVNEIMPLVWAQRSDLKVQIVGKDPPPSIRSLAENPNIAVTGTVADIRPYLQRATLAVAPIPYGAGIQNKILEAMACATPVIASPKAVSALLAAPGRDVLVAETAVQFAQAILSLVNAPHRQREIGAAGRAYVERNHDWHVIAAQLAEIYAAAVRDNTSGMAKGERRSDSDRMR